MNGKCNSIFSHFNKMCETLDLQVSISFCHLRSYSTVFSNEIELNRKHRVRVLSTSYLQSHFWMEWNGWIEYPAYRPIKKIIVSWMWHGLDVVITIWCYRFRKRDENEIETKNTVEFRTLNEKWRTKRRKYQPNRSNREAIRTHSCGTLY